MTTELDALRSGLVAALRKAGVNYEHRKAVYVSPYSGHDALVEFHRAFGHQSGLAHAIEIIDALVENEDSS